MRQRRRKNRRSLVKEKTEAHMRQPKSEVVTEEIEEWVVLVSRYVDQVS